MKKWNLRKNDMHDPPFSFHFYACRRCRKPKRPNLQTLKHFKSVKSSQFINHTKKVFISCSHPYSTKWSKITIFVFLVVSLNNWLKIEYNFILTENLSSRRHFKNVITEWSKHTVILNKEHQCPVEDGYER